jgi:hypothetical protein
MLTLPSETGSDSTGDGYGQDTAYARSFEIDFKKIIALANNSISCLAIMEQAGVKFTYMPAQNGWTHKATCPFKSHKNGRERTPSFSYNSKEDRFFCFGCNKSGKAVEFIAFTEGRNKLEVARDILAYAGVNEHDAVFIADDSNEKINEILFDFAKFAHDIVDQNRFDSKAIKTIDNIMYCMDMYVAYTVTCHTFDLDELQRRVERYKERLKQFAKP